MKHERRTDTVKRNGASNHKVGTGGRCAVCEHGERRAVSELLRSVSAVAIHVHFWSNRHYEIRIPDTVEAESIVLSFCKGEFGQVFLQAHPICVPHFTPSVAGLSSSQSILWASDKMHGTVWNSGTCSNP